VTGPKPPADTSWLPTERLPEPARRDDSVPRWLVVLLVLVTAAALLAACVLSAAGVEAWQFFHHQNGIIQR
jgi:hypothetical protein